MVNAKLVADKLPDFMKRSIHAHSLSEGAAAILREGRRRKNRSTAPVTIRVAGPSCSGKTTLVERLLLPKLDSAAYYMIDHDYLGLRFLTECRKEGLSITWDDPDALDLARTAWHLGLLRNRQPLPGRWVFNFSSNEPDRYEGPLQPGEHIVTEGLYSLFDILDGPYDITAFVRTSSFGQIIRRLIRDQKRSHKTPEEIMADLVYAVIPRYKKYVEPTLHKAQIVIDNDYDALRESGRITCREVPLHISGFLERTKNTAEYCTGTVFSTDTHLSVTGRHLQKNGETIIIREQGEKVFFIYKGPFTTISRTAGRPLLQVEINRDIAGQLVSILGTRTKTEHLELLSYSAANETIVRQRVCDTDSGHSSVYLIRHD